MFFLQTKEADLLELSLRLQDAEELSEGLRKELKTSQADKEAQVHKIRSKLLVYFSFLLSGFSNIRIPNPNT